MIRALTVALALSLASLAGSWAQNSPHVPSAAPALIVLEQDWAAALQRADKQALDTILAATFVDIDEDGHQTDKRRVLATIGSGQLKVTSMSRSRMRIYAYGDAAVVTGTAAQMATFRGRALAPKVLFTDTFVLRGGAWRAVASHRSALHGQ